MPVAEEYEIDEPINKMTSNDAYTYAQIYVSKYRLVFKNWFNFTSSFQTE